MITLDRCCFLLNRSNSIVSIFRNLAPFWSYLNHPALQIDAVRFVNSSQISLEHHPIANHNNHLEVSLTDCLSSIGREWNKSSIEKACTIYHSSDSRTWEINYSSAGNSASVSIDLKHVLKRLTDEQYNKLVICHYHPTGSNEPSEIDLQTTRQVAQLCRSLGVILFDHVIFGTTPSFSFREAGYL